MKLSGFSALQRAEIAEIVRGYDIVVRVHQVSVLFNEPKLLKFQTLWQLFPTLNCFSALQRAEIAEICCKRKYG